LDSCDKSNGKNEENMSQLHKKFGNEQVKAILRNYQAGQMSREHAQELLEIGKSRFFTLLQQYRSDPSSMSIEYQRKATGRISAETDQIIRQELKREKDLVEDERLPISSYNYTALRDRLKQKGITVSVPTIIKRAIEEDCYRPRRKQKVHDRLVVTSAIGEMIQHDASVHLWSPLASEKWTLITSLDDYSRTLLFADFFAHETSWAHIQAAQTVLVKNGLPVRYYVDNLRVFRFIQKRDSFWRNHILETDDVDPQWRQVMRLLKVGVTYALSPQAKGKIERPFRWLQDRIVRTCALEGISSFEDARVVLQAEVDRYNNHQVHSTTGEIPAIRFEKALSTGNSLFRPFSLPKPFSSLKDVFCLRDTRTLNGYRKITLGGMEIEIPLVPIREDVDIHFVPLPSSFVEVRIWYENKMVHSLTMPAVKFPGVHF
jgi:transposase